MATESPMRLVETTGARKWPTSKEATAFASSSHNMATEEIEMLLKGHRFQENGREVVPNRSGSAPPSMEGSVAAMGHLINQQNINLDASLNNASGNCEPEEKFRTDPAYLAYYCSNVNLNPRLPPPLVSRENRRLVRHIGGYGNNWRLTSFDDTGSHGALSTHKEEPEDDMSPPPGDSAERSGEFLSGHYTSSLEARHKSLVDLIQEDFPRTPSPVYLSLSSSQPATEEAVDPDGHGNSLHDPSTNTSRLSEPDAPSVAIVAGLSTVGITTSGSITNGDPSTASFPSSSSPNRTESSLPARKGKLSSAHTHLEDDNLMSGVTDSDIESEMKGLNIYNLPNNMDHSSKQHWQYSQQNHLQQQQQQQRQQQLHPQQGATYQVQRMQSRIVSQGLNNLYNGMDQIYHGQSKQSSVHVQPVFQPPGISPPLYATTAAYTTSTNPFFPNLQQSGVFAPQYSLGGYALNTALLPPFMSGYPPHSAIPIAIDTAAGPTFNARAAGFPTGGSAAPGVDLQHPYKFYGQFGLTGQPSFTDPLYMQYFQQPPEDAYVASGQHDHMVSRGVLIGDHSQRGASMAAYTADQQPHYQRNGGPSPSYYGSPPSMGALMQFSTSPLASPVMPGSPVGRISPAGRRNEMRFPVFSNQNTGVYSGWPGQRGADKFDDHKTYSYLEELKSSKARKFELSDIAGRIIEFSADQHGSRFIQQRLENCSIEEKASVFNEVLPHASKLMTDVFGNYVIQKFFEHGSTEQKKELANQLVGHILPLSLQMYGCRVIQKALEVIEPDQKTQLAYELDGHVLICVRDQNGNHVIQKCIESVPTEKNGFIISAFRGQVATLSTHPYGCRVIQRVLEYCTDELKSQCIVDEILESALTLAQDQYGNYVIQHILERGKPKERSYIISKMAGQIVLMSQHKFASNVVEKCLQHGDDAEQELLIEEVVGQTEGNDNLLTMMKDQFANYVVQKILETCTERQREILLSRIRIHVHALKKYTYGKHIVVRFEQVSGEEIDAET